MRTLSIPTGKLLVIPGETMPEDATPFIPNWGKTKRLGYRRWVGDARKGKVRHFNIHLPPGSWSLLGKASELTYEQKGVICKRENGYFEDYCGDGYLFTSVTLSYVSFLTFHGIKPDDYLLIENKK